MSKSLPELIKELRETTQAPMMDCKKALEENNLDLTAAAKWLREKGIAKAVKKLSSVAADGQVSIAHAARDAVIFEVNCQTDFTAMNEHFIALVHNIGKALLKGKPKDLAAANALRLSSDETVEEACMALTGKIGEKIALRRFQIFTAKEDGALGAYVHTGGRIATVVVLEGSTDSAAAKDVAMHAAAMNPKFLDRTSYDPAWLASEREVLLAQTIAEGKPKERATQIVEGRLAKLLTESCLVDQVFVKDASKKVGEFVKPGRIASFARYELGEGIERQTTNFADEVAAQMRDAKKA